MTKEDKEIALRSQQLTMPLTAGINRERRQTEVASGREAGATIERGTDRRQQQGQFDTRMGQQQDQFDDRMGRQDEQFDEEMMMRRASLHMKNQQFLAEAQRQQTTMQLRREMNALQLDDLNFRREKFKTDQVTKEKDRKISMAGTRVIDLQGKEGEQFGVYTAAGQRWFKSQKEMNEYMELAHPEQEARRRSEETRRKYTEGQTEHIKTIEGQRDRQLDIDQGEAESRAMRDKAYAAKINWGIANPEAAAKMNLFGVPFAGLAAQEVGKVGKTDRDITRYQNDEIGEVLKAAGIDEETWAKIERGEMDKSTIDPKTGALVAKKLMEDDKRDEILKQIQAVKEKYSGFTELMKKIKKPK